MRTAVLRTSLPISGMALLLFFVPAVFAQTISPTGTTIKKHAGANANLSIIITKGDSLIQQRLATLNTFLTNINNAKRLNSTEKAQYTTNITATISGLTSLKAKLDADTDAATARADVQSIFLTYRVYAEFDPATHLLAAADTMTTTTDQLTQLSAKLQSRITSAQTSGQSVSALTALLTDMNAKIADAKTQYTNIESQVSVLTPSGYNSNPTATKTTLQTARTEILTGRTDLKTALSDAKQIILGLKALKTTTSTTSTASATATATP